MTQINDTGPILPTIDEWGVVIRYTIPRSVSRLCFTLVASLTMLTTNFSGIARAASGAKLSSIRQIVSDFEGRRLLFSTCATEPCTIGIHDIETNQVRTIKNNTQYAWFTPSAPTKNNKILVAAVQGRNSHIATVNIENGEFELLTGPSGYNMWPRFSSTLTTIYYAHADLKTNSRGAPFTGFSMYSYDTLSKTTNRIPIRRLVSLTGPYPITDGSIVFSSFGENLISGNLDDIKFSDPFEYVYRSDMMGNLHEIETIASPEILNPVSSADGKKLVLTAVINKIDGIKGRFLHDVFLTENNKIARITHEQWITKQLAFSGDGSTVMVVTESPTTKKLSLYRIDVKSKKVTSLAN